MIDIVVNNAGLQQDAPFHEMTLAQWRKVIDVNLTGQFLCARAAVREFLRRGLMPQLSCSLQLVAAVGRAAGLDLAYHKLREVRAALAAKAPSASPYPVAAAATTASSAPTNPAPVSQA